MFSKGHSKCILTFTGIVWLIAFYVFTYCFPIPLRYAHTYKDMPV